MTSKYKVQEHRDTNYRNNEIKFTEMHKYKCRIYRNTKTEIHIREKQITGLQKYKLQKYRNTNYRNKEIQKTNIKKCK